MKTHQGVKDRTDTFGEICDSKPSHPLADMYAMRQALFRSNSFQVRFDCEGFLISKIKKYDPILCAATIAGISLSPQLQSNAIRCDAMVHFFLNKSKGKCPPDRKNLQKVFKTFSGSYGREEDPAEDVFISLVSSQNMNFRVFEGTWESSGFITQRFVDIVDTFPDEEPFKTISRRVFTLLKLSEALAEKNGLNRYVVGNTCPVCEIPFGRLGDFEKLREKVAFSSEDLAANGISEEDLRPFIFTEQDRLDIGKSDRGASPIERRPIAHYSGVYYVVLPSALSLAVRRSVVDEISKIGCLEILKNHMGRAYASHFYETPILGKLIHAPIVFRDVEGVDIQIAECLCTIDTGRYLQLLFILDDFNGADQGWFNGSSDSSGKVGDELTKRISKAKQYCEDQDEFKDGITLVVACLWGRALLCGFNFDRGDNWKIESISAYDLTTLSYCQKFAPLSLWRLLHAKSTLDKYGSKIINLNGLLNLYAWSKSLGHHLVPHKNIPSDASPSNFCMMIDQNGLLDLRREVFSSWDRHIEIDNNNHPTMVSRVSNDYFFNEDQFSSRYIDILRHHLFVMGIFTC